MKEYFNQTICVIKIFTKREGEREERIKKYFLTTIAKVVIVAMNLKNFSISHDVN